MTVSSRPDALHADFARADPAVATLLPERWARRLCVVPLYREHGTLVVATSDAGDLDAERTIAFATGHRIRLADAALADVLAHIDRVYLETARAEISAPPVEVKHIGFAAPPALPESAEEATSAIQLVDQLLAEGIQAGASDIHIEPEEQGIAVRHRVDGVLRQVRLLARSLAPSLVSRVKILSGLDIADRMRPQDGRARIAVRGAVVDLRISTLPASHGEKIVVRVLDGSAGLRSLDLIGFVEEDLARIRTLLEQREGLVLVTGPTGSGKTTTLYAALREVQARGVNVVTVEDPIEYRLPGIVQVQVHERAGLTFGAALRSIMRQDPDVILVGEIRDRETAEIAIQASLTGHLVLSTLHTNDAASAIARLIDIGAASYQIATAVKGVIAQRLVRRLCTGCSGQGCRECGDTGYRGRRAIAEILVASPEFERRVAAGGTPESIADAARANGCVPLWEAGLALVRRGDTSIDELRRVAAEPARRVGEPALIAPAPNSSNAAGPTLPSDTGAPSADAGAAGRQSRAVVRIGWASSGPIAAATALRSQIVAAAASLERAVELVPIGEDDAAGATLDALVAVGGTCVAVAQRLAVLRAIASAGASDGAGPPLVVALAPAGSVGEHVRILEHDADVVLSANNHGRVVLATVLALLRWRAR